MSAVLYGCKIWFPILDEGNRKRVFENRVLREIVGRMMEDVTDGYIKLHYSELYFSILFPVLLQ
jgi:site-specific recombinase